MLTALERFLGGPAGAQPPVDLSLAFRDAKPRTVKEFERAHVARPPSRARAGRAPLEDGGDLL